MSRLTFRILDVIYAFGLGLLLSPLILAVALILLLREGPPVFYGSERMRDRADPSRSGSSVPCSRKSGMGV